MTSMGRTVRMLLGCMLILAAAACDEDIPDDLLLPDAHRHASGLVAFRPDGFDVIDRPAGFEFRESGMIRAPRNVEVWLSDIVPDIAAVGRRRLPGGSTAEYATLRHEGGMGGPEYELVAWRPDGARWIVVTERAQSEWGEPDFIVAWALIDRVRIAPVE